jgi:HTH-type transcriptional regulator, sugar sensing transcriptional regulator
MLPLEVADTNGFGHQKKNNHLSINHIMVGLGLTCPCPTSNGMLHELQKIGLSENESKIYLASLEIGRATADELAKQADIKRPTAYVQIESLIKKGLMSTYDEEKKTYFVPESPEYLQRIISEKMDAIQGQTKKLHEFLPLLQDVFAHSGERPTVRFFSGKDGINTLREEVLKCKSKELLTIFSTDALEKVFSLEERVAYSNKRSRKCIALKALYTREKGPYEKITNPLSEMKFVESEKLPIETDILIFDDNVALIALEGKLFGALIKSPVIARSISALFSLLWRNTDKHR